MACGISIDGQVLKIHLADTVQEKGRHDSSNSYPTMVQQGGDTRQDQYRHGKTF
jgi:hypothetical protein